MPHKQQNTCYRTIGGRRWPNLCDIIGEEEERIVADYRKAGGRIRFVKHPQGFRSAFVHPDDYTRFLTPINSKAPL